VSSFTTGVAGGSGLDVQSVVEQILQAERAPQRLLQRQQQTIDAQAAALRSLQSQLDRFEASINALKDVSGVLGTRNVTSSDQEILTATSSSEAVLGTHTVCVSRLATTASWYSNRLANPNATFSPGSFDIQVGTSPSVTVTLGDGRNTLASAAAYINTLGLGVTASVVNDAQGARLSLASKSSGAPGNISITNDSTSLGLTRGVTGTNAQLTVDGIPLEAASNTVQGVLQGITIRLGSASPSTQVTLQVAPDTAKLTAAVRDMVSSYNALVNSINTQFAVNPETGSAGVLAGDSTLRVLQGRLLSIPSFVFDGSGTYKTLASLGVTMKNDGTLAADDAAVSTAVSSHYEDFRKFFYSVSPAGFAVRMSTELMALTDSTDGPLTVTLSGLNATTRSIADQMDAFEARLADREKQLYDQYSRIDVMLRKLPTLQSQITAQLGSLNQK